MKTLIIVLVIFIIVFVLIKIIDNERFNKFAVIIGVVGSIITILTFLFSGDSESNSNTNEIEQKGVLNQKNEVNTNVNNGPIIQGDNNSLIQGDNNIININNSDNDSSVDPDKLFPIEPEFINVKSSKFNYQINYPINFQRMETNTEQEGDKYYYSLDNNASLQIIARKYNKDLPLDEIFTIEGIVNDPNIFVMTKEDHTKTEGWYAIGYKKKDNVVYEKCLMDGENVRKFIFIYPINQMKMYHDNYDYVTTIEKSFVKLQ